MESSLLPALEDICSAEWLEWYAMTPAQRWVESQQMWATFLALGGSLHPEPDSQSPFADPEEANTQRPQRRFKVIRRSGI